MAKNINKENVKDIVNDMVVFRNEYNENEIDFRTYDIAKKVLDVSKSVDIYCYIKEDVTDIDLLKVNIRNLNPLVNGIRIK